jgi:ABC-type sugar transport system permease subunit
VRLLVLKKYKLLPLLTFLLLGSAISLFLGLREHYFMSAIFFFVSVASGFIFGNKEAYAFRFLYPGLITFLFFMVLPIVFTVYIGFTNLSTGHYLSQDQATEALLQEKRLAPNSNIIGYRLHPTGKSLDSLRILVNFPTKTYFTRFNINSNKQSLELKPIDEYPKTTPLSKAQTFSISDKLRKFVFKLPEQNLELRYFRTTKLASFLSTYELEPSSGSFNRFDGQVFKADLEDGNFVNPQTGETLLPGFYVHTGFKNFLYLFKNSEVRGPFWDIVKWTFTWGFFSVLLTFLFGMTLAIVLNEKDMFAKKVYRTLFVIPYSIPFFISVLIFRGMLNKDFGIINEVLSTVGITHNIAWLEVPVLAKISCLLVNLWLGFPYMFLVTTGILQSIPSSIYEAAKLDGSSTWNTFHRITLPLIMQAIGPILIGSFAFNLNNFIGIYLLTGGGPPIPGSTTPAGSTDILISYTYRLAFEGGQGQNFGLASSISILIFFAIAIITFVNFRISGFNQKEASK